MAAPGQEEAWFRVRLPPDGQDLGFHVSFASRAFEAYCGDRLVYSFTHPKTYAPQHWVDLVGCSPGDWLSLHVHGRLRDGIGFHKPFQLGARAQLWWSVVRQSGWAAILGVLFFASGLAAVFAHFASMVKGQVASLRFGLVLIINGIGGFARSDIGGLLLGNSTPWFCLLVIATFMSPISGAYYYSLIFRGRGARRMLQAVSTAFLGVLALFIADVYLESDTWPRILEIGSRFLCLFDALLLALCIAYFKRSSAAMRVALIGLVTYTSVSVWESVYSFFGTFPPVLASDFGFAGWLFFMASSLMIIARDQRRLYEAAQLGAAQAKAVAMTTQMLAHDVRKPFTLMTMLLDLLGGAETFDDMKRTLVDARDEVSAARRSVDGMIEDVMEMGSVAAPITAPVEVVDVLQATLMHFFARPARPYSVGIRYRLGHTWKLNVHRAKVERALLNLVGNALEAMHGRGDLWFESRDIDRAGQRFIEMIIGNSNSFIPPESLEKLFNPFFTSGKANGTGLGLAIVHKVVTAHGGDIECKSSREVGVEFVVCLPASDERSTACAKDLPTRSVDLERGRPPTERPAGKPDPASEVPASAPEAPPRFMPARHVVLVEDSRAVVRAWRRRLGDANLVAFSSPSGLLAAVRERPSILGDALCVVLDNDLGPDELRGDELAIELRGLTTTPLILSSDDGLPEVPRGIDARIAKAPLSVDEVKALLLGLGADA